MRFVQYIFLFWLTCSAGSAHAEIIRSYETAIDLTSDGVMNVTETITYDYSGTEKHGIYRDILLSVPDTASNPFFERYLDIDIIGVTRNGILEPYKIEPSRKQTSLKIGSESVTLSGTQVYEIQYTVRGGLVRFTDGTLGLSFNAVPGDWPVGIGESRVTVSAPEGALDPSVVCYSWGNDCQVRAIDERTFVYENQGPITIEQRVDESLVVYAPTERLKLLPLLIGLFGALLAISFFQAVRYRNEFRYTRAGAVVTQYEPYPNVSPIVMSYLKRRKVDAIALTAGVLSLIYSGVFSFRHVPATEDTEEDFVLTLKSTTVHDAVDQRIIELFFPAQVIDESISLNKFNETGKTNVGEGLRRSYLLKKIKSILNATLVDEGFMGSFKLTFLSRWTGMFVLAGLLSLLVYLENEVLGQVLAVMSLITTFVILHIISLRFTEKGYDYERYTDGFKDFLSVTETERYAFHENPRNHPEYFMKYLPYAIALGVAKEWAGLFSTDVITASETIGIGTRDPNLIVSTLGHFAMSVNRTVLNSKAAERTARAKMSSSRGFGSGGIGLGGGGGGGRSW